MQEQENKLSKIPKFILVAMLEGMGAILVLTQIITLLNASYFCVVLGFSLLAFLVAALIYQVIWLFSPKRIERSPYVDMPRLSAEEEKEQSIKL